MGFYLKVTSRPQFQLGGGMILTWLFVSVYSLLLSACHTCSRGRGVKGTSSLLSTQNTPSLLSPVLKPKRQRVVTSSQDCLFCYFCVRVEVCLSQCMQDDWRRSNDCWNNLCMRVQWQSKHVCFHHFPLIQLLTSSVADVSQWNPTFVKIHPLFSKPILHLSLLEECPLLLKKWHSVHVHESFTWHP